MTLKSHTGLSRIKNKQGNPVYIKGSGFAVNINQQMYVN